MPAIRLARHPAVHPNGLTARAGLVLLAALASVLVAGRLQVPPAVRTSAVGRVPTALVVDALTGHVFVANRDSTTVSMLDAASGAVLATVAVPPHPSALAVATIAGRAVMAPIFPGHGSGRSAGRQYERTAGRAEEQERPNEPVPPQPEYQAVGVAAQRRRGS